MACAKTCAQDSRISYLLILFLSVLLATILRYWGGEFVSYISIESLGLCTTYACYGFQAVYRISAALTFFYFSLALFVTCCGRQFKCMLDSVILQLVYYAGLLFAFWFLPDEFYSGGYVQGARFISGCFLLFQVMLLISITHDWNQQMLDSERYNVMMAVTVGLFVASAVIIILMFLWFGVGDCGLQNTSISITLLSIFMFSCLSITRGIVGDRGSLLVSAVLAFYCCWMNFSALSSDPSTCNTVAERDSLFWLIVGLVWSGISVTYTGWRSSTRAATFLDKDGDSEGSYTPRSEDDQAADADTEEEESDPVTLKYFFVVMGACAMYMAMLLTNWASTEDLNSDSLLSEPSMWVQLISEWATIVLYFWVLVAPALFPNREW
jgi:hypothetical protein